MSVQQQHPSGHRIVVGVDGSASSKAALAWAVRQAGLLVVGSRGHRSFTGALLGSVSHHCAHHARCPLVIIRGGGSL